MNMEKGCTNLEYKKQFERHIFFKTDSYQERKSDRESRKVALCFDMENVIQLLRSNVSNFFYKRKLSFFKLTVHSSIDNKVYCCVWSEYTGGRNANCIASASVKVLRQFVLEHPNVTEIILWSDSCVPHNRNSILAFALKGFMLENTHVKTITQKFSEKGHSLVQKVDIAHSCIEKTLERNEMFSLISLIRALKTVRRKPQLHILQMRSADFFNFEKLSKTMNFLKIPFFSVKQLKYHSNLPHFIAYKECHSNTEPDLCVSILKRKNITSWKKHTFAGNSPNIQCLIIKSTSSSKQRKN